MNIEQLGHKTLSDWQNHFERQIQQAANTPKGGSLAELGRVLSELDRVEGSVPERQKALAESLLRFPNAVELLARLRSKDSGKAIDGTTLLRNVSSGMSELLEGVNGRDAVKHKAPGEHASDIRAAKERISEEETLRNLGRKLDQAAAGVLATRKKEVSGLGSSELGKVLKSYLAQQSDPDFAIQLGTTGLFFGRGGIISGGLKEWYEHSTGDGYVSCFKPIFVRLRPHQLVGISAKEVEDAMAAAVASIGSGAPPAGEARELYWLRYGSSSEQEVKARTHTEPVFQGLTQA
jgi:hypothetical protein